MSIKTSLTLFVLAVASLCSFTIFAAQTPKISQNDLLALLSQQQTLRTEFIVLDVRTPKEFNNGHIKGAINISHNTISEHLSFLETHKDKMIVVHCRSGVRARSAESVLHANGFTNLRHLEGDMLGWLSAKHPIIKEK